MVGFIVRDMNEFDLLLCESSQSVNLDMLEKRKELTNSIWNKLLRKDILLKQKSIQKWLIERDLNTRYFHNVIKSRRKRNVILLMEIDRGLVDNV